MKQTVSGKLAGSYLPGTLVYETATGVWTATAVAGANHIRSGWIEFKKRTSATFGEVDIDATYTNGTAINVEIIVGPRGNANFTIVSKCTNPGGTKYFGEEFTNNAAGVLQRKSAAASRHTVAIVTKYGLSNGDTVGRFHPM